MSQYGSLAFKVFDSSFMRYLFMISQTPTENFDKGPK